MAATSPRDRLLRVLLLAGSPAVAFSAYACDEGGTAPAAEIAGSGGAGSGGASSSSLPPIPKGKGGNSGGYPLCQQRYAAGGGDGVCCLDIYCVPAVASSCPAADEVSRGVGTGSCSCDPTTGPYDPGALEPSGDSKGKDCCYLAGVTGCDGRPLLAGGVARVAALSASEGWA